MIKQFTQGNPATEDDLFISLGSMVLSKDVHDKMGKPVNSRTGDIWWIVYDRQGARMGFAQARGQAAGLNVRYLYANGLAAKTELTQEILKYAKASSCGRVFSQHPANFPTTNITA